MVEERRECLREWSEVQRLSLGTQPTSDLPTPTRSTRIRSFWGKSSGRSCSAMRTRISEAVVDGLLTAVGGARSGISTGPTNTLLSFTGGDGQAGPWSEVFPPMITSRESEACVTSDPLLVVVGGFAHDFALDNVEVMNTGTKQWSVVPSLPQRCSRLTGTICGDTVYFAGESMDSSLSNTVFSCSKTELLANTKFVSKLRQTLSRKPRLWKEKKQLPVTDSTLGSFQGQLLAIGGWSTNDGLVDHTANIYRYDSKSDLWTVATEMAMKRSECLAASLHGVEEQLIIVGGYTAGLSTKTEAVEILQ